MFAPDAAYVIQQFVADYGYTPAVNRPPPAEVHRKKTSHVPKTVSNYSEQRRFPSRKYVLYTVTVTKGSRARGNNDKRASDQARLHTWETASVGHGTGLLARRSQHRLQRPIRRQLSTSSAGGQVGTPEQVGRAVDARTGAETARKYWPHLLRAVESN